MKITLKGLVTITIAFLAIPVFSQQQDKGKELQLRWQDGPSDVNLIGQAVLKLPEGYKFLNAEQTKEALRRSGNFPSDNTLGLIVPIKKQAPWFAVLTYHPVGYVKDDDAKNWNAEELLTAVKEGTEHDNKQRKEMGFPPISIVGWEEKPHYDSTTNKVIWAIAAKDNTANASTVVNFNTLSLGRQGYIGMNMVTGLNELAQQKQDVQILLGQLNFVDGKRYADFNSNTDTIAAVGLAALVAGAAAKLGFFGKLGAFLLPIFLVLKKFIVYIVIAIAAIGWALFKKFRGAKAEAPAE